MILILLFSLILIAALLDFSSRQNRGFIFSIFLIISIQSIRWNSATDFQMYYDIFTQHRHKVTFIEGLYFAFNNFIGIFTDNFTVFLFLHSAVVWLFFYLGLKRFKCSNNLALLFLFSITIGLLGANRQMIALAISFYAVTYLLENRKIIFLLLIALAIGFHVSVAIMLPAVFFNRNINFKTWMGFFLLVLIFNFSGLLVNFFRYIIDQALLPEYFLKKAVYYFNTMEQSGNALYRFPGLIRKIFPAAILYYYKDQLVSQEKYQVLMNIFMFGILLFLFSIGSFNFLLGRLTIYYSIYELLVYTWVAYRYFYIQNKTFVFLTLTLLAFVFFLKSIAPYPEIFIPYKTIFFNF